MCAPEQKGLYQGIVNSFQRALQRNLGALLRVFARLPKGCGATIQPHGYAQRQPYGAVSKACLMLLSKTFENLLEALLQSVEGRSKEFVRTLLKTV